VRPAYAHAESRMLRVQTVSVCARQPKVHAAGSGVLARAQRRSDQDLAGRDCTGTSAVVTGDVPDLGGIGFVKKIVSIRLGSWTTGARARALPPGSGRPRFHSNRTALGSVIRDSSGSVVRITARETARPAPTVR
jgi:hypothetical protein